MENKKNNILIGMLILTCFCLFSTLAFMRVNVKKEIKAQNEKNEQLAQQLKEQQQKEQEKLNALKTPTPTPIDNVLDKNDTITAQNISNYPINQLKWRLNGVESSFPFTVNSIVTFGYLFQDKISNATDGHSYTFNQLSEMVKAKSYHTSWIYAMSPNKQVVGLLVKNNSDVDTMIKNCDVYGVTAYSCTYGETVYGKTETEPTLELDNGLFLGMTEGDMIKVMGTYDKAFYPTDNEKIIRYQWYQSTDGVNIQNILTCDVINGYVQMLSIEIGD